MALSTRRLWLWNFPGGSLQALAKTPKHYPLNCEIGVYNFTRRLRAPALFTRALVCFMKKVVAPVCHFITGGNCYTTPLQLLCGLKMSTQFRGNFHMIRRVCLLAPSFCWIFWDIIINRSLRLSLSLKLSVFSVDTFSEFHEILLTPLVCTHQLYNLCGPHSLLFALFQHFVTIHKFPSLIVFTCSWHISTLAPLQNGNYEKWIRWKLIKNLFWGSRKYGLCF